MELRRTVPFIAVSSSENDLVILLDRVEAKLTAASNRALAGKVVASLSLGPSDGQYTAAQAEEIVQAQYESCLEYIYSEPAWRRIRDTGDSQFLRAYLLENRHYLAAAPFRMAAGVAAGPRPDRLIELQARHVVEEADHDVFFENALARLGCPRTLVRAARPSPVTVEWIHLMRSVAESGSLAAAICSGLLEFTAGNRSAVTGWHEHLVTSGQLPADAVAAIFEHVKTDLGLGHGANWRAALRAAGTVPAQTLADILNDTTLVAEMIDRWIRSLAAGIQDRVVERLPDLPPRPVTPALLGREADGLPVWPAGILDTVAHGHPENPGSGVAVTVALAYALGGGERAAVLRDAAARESGPGHRAPERSVESAAADLAAHFTEPATPPAGAAGLEKLVLRWMRAIDGHRLWTELTTRPTYPLVYGWLVENYHYIAAIWQHCGAGIAACPDPRMRLELVHHLEEEFEHGAEFLEGMRRIHAEGYQGIPVTCLRPLATTRAFTGMLRGLAQRDWKAYVLAIAFLQLSLTVSAGRPAGKHAGFYRAVSERLPEAEPLLRIMQHHDDEDTQLGHASDVRRLLELLSAHELTTETISAASLLPQLAWGFLDGILEHYARGEAAVVQRVGWHVDMME